MIAALTGELVSVTDDRAYVQAGPILYELLIPVFDLDFLRGVTGREAVFHTIYYLEGDSGGGNIEPRLVGFLRKQDKAFFQLFITVKGIGPKKALRALALPVGEIAQAIEAKDARFLQELPQIGKRMAELIVAELSGKARAFIVSPEGVRPPTPAGRVRAAAEEDAIQTLMALGERRVEAELLLDRAKQSGQPLTGTDALVREMLRLRSPRA